MTNSKKDLGTQKRKHLTSLVRKATKKRDWLRLKLEWDTELFDDKLSCCRVVFRGEGNIFSLYTWTKKRRVENVSLPGFNSVEVSLFDKDYENLVNQLCAELSRNGYVVGMTKDYVTTGSIPFEVFYRDK